MILFCILGLLQVLFVKQIKVGALAFDHGSDLLCIKNIPLPMGIIKQKYIGCTSFFRMFIFRYWKHTLDLNAVHTLDESCSFPQDMRFELSGTAGAIPQKLSNFAICFCFRLHRNFLICFGQNFQL